MHYLHNKNVSDGTIQNVLSYIYPELGTAQNTKSKSVSVKEGIISSSDFLQYSLVSSCSIGQNVQWLPSDFTLNAAKQAQSLVQILVQKKSYERLWQLERQDFLSPHLPPPNQGLYSLQALQPQAGGGTRDFLDEG